MRQTNYQLFDFLDFDTNLNSDDRLWKASTPTHIKEQNGSIYITIPSQIQNNSNEITPDNSITRKEYKLRIQAFGDKMLRSSIVFEGEIAKRSEMLELAGDLNICPLHFIQNTDNTKSKKHI